MPVATVMPTATYPKTYRVNGTDYTIHNAAEDTSFQAGPIYHAAITVLTYPKTLVLGAHTIKVNDAAAEASARSKFGQG